MKYHVQKNDGRPVYLQLYQQLKSDIVASVYRYGSKLPSKRLLAAEMGISVIPVEHALALLCDEGYVESRERSGCFVIYREGDFGGGVLPEPEGMPLAGGGHPAGHPHPAGGRFPYSVLAKTMRRVLQDYGEQLLVKSPNHGCAELRRAISAYLARSNGMSVRPEQIIIGSGAEYLYSLIAQLLSGRVFGLESPCYEKIAQVYHASGVTCEMLRLGREGIRTADLERTRATVLHVTPFNSYPSGVTADASKRQEYVRWAEGRGGYIIEDNYDSELTVSRKSEDTVFSTARQGLVIYLNTFSRTVAPSIRVGYMVLPDGLLETFDRRLGFYSCTVPVFEQYVLAQLIENGDFERHINRVRRARRKGLLPGDG